MTEHQLLTKICRSSKTHIRLERGQFDGREVLTLREFYLDPEGQWKPTRKGINMTVSNWKPVYEALRSVFGDGPT
jgi:hypothetical protein